jgi:hypothetical protein
MDIDTLYLFRKAVAADVIVLFDNETFFTRRSCLLRENRPKKPGSDDQIIVHCIEFYF